MSYPIHSLNRNGASRVVRVGSGFWGYDPSRNARDRSPERAADTENLIWKGEALGRRAGYSVCATLPDTVYGIFFYRQELLVHAGNTLYRRKAEGAAFEAIYRGLNPAPSQAVIHYQQITRRWLKTLHYYGWHRETLRGDILFLSDQKRLIFYDGNGVHSVADLFWGEALDKAMADGNIEPSFYATVPFASVAKAPRNDPGDTDPRGDNRLSQFRAESFYVGETATVSFQLNCTRAELNQKIPVEMLVRDEEGEWHTFACIGSDSFEFEINKAFYCPAVTIAAGRAFDVDEEGRINAWGNGNKKMAADNSDNLRIIYSVIKEKPDALIGATVMGRFGSDGADNVLFLGGSADAPGVDAFSASDDFTCFYETATEVIGSNAAPITGYCRLTDGRMAVLKNETDGVNVYFRNHAVVSIGTTAGGGTYQIDVFPSCGGAAVPGCVSPLTVGSVGNEPIFLSDAGLYSVKSVSDTLVNMNQTVHRSESVDSYLKEIGGAPFSICWKGYYLLCFGREALITDGKREGGALRFLKWRFSHEMTAFGKRGDTLWLGDADGAVYCMDDSDLDAGEPFNAFWKTALPEDSGGCRMLLKKVWIALSPDYRGEAEATLIHNRCPDAPLPIPLLRLDFSDWDFGAVCFEGANAPRWVSILRRAAVADSFSAELCIKSGQQLKLWGIRMQYEKGGVMA